jgi:hypothetical protein
MNREVVMTERGWLRLVRRLRAENTPLVVFLTLVLVLSTGLLVSRAQSQTCRDVVNITVCGDTITDLTANGGGFRLSGDVRIGPKGQPAVVKVGNLGNVFDGSILNASSSTASYFHLLNQIPRPAQPIS